MLKRWDARNYDFKLILEIFDSIDINIEEMNIPRPKKYDIKFLMKVLLVKEFEKLRNKIHRFTRRSAAKFVYANVLLLGILIRVGYKEKEDLQRLAEW